MSTRLALLLGCACVLANASRTAARTFAVDSETDAVDAQLGDGICASADGHCTLRAAVQEANALSGIDTIHVPPGHYELTIPPSGVGTGASGALDITDGLTITGAGADVTTIDGGGRDRVFTVRALESYAKIGVNMWGITIQNGKSPKGSSGGGISTDGNLSLQEVTVTNNRAVSGPLQNGGRGGGISNRGDLTLVKAIVCDNRADDAGGGIANLGGRVTVTDTVLRDNTSLTDRGGAIANDGLLTVAVSTVTHNSAEEEGGGIVSIGGTVTVASSTISDNTADAGGGIAALGGTISLVNTTVCGNHAYAQGGGMFARAPAAMRLNEVTVATNTADGGAHAGGGGIATAKGARPSMSNTLIAENTDRSQHGPDCFGTLVSYGYNLFQIASGCTVRGNTTGNIIGESPRLAALSDAGGPTQTQPLLPGSPAVDAGNPAAPGSGDRTCETGDQRGVSRPIDGDGDGVARCDIGAFELQPPVSGSAGATPIR